MDLARILKITAAILVAVIVIGVIYLWFADFGKYKPDIEAAVTDATGREFHINGELEITALPRPFVRMENVTLANAPWSAEPQMLEVGHASVKVGLWSLLFRPVVVHDLQLRDVTVIAEANAEEEFNWSMGDPDEQPEPEEESEAGSGEPLVDLRTVDISNVRFVYRKPGADDMTAAIESLTLSESDAGAKTIDGRGQLTDWPLALSGTIDDVDAQIEASLGDVRYRSTTHYENSALDIDLALGTLDNVGKLFDVENLPIEELTVSGNIGMRDDTIVLTDVVAGLATASVTINGELDGGSQSARFSLDASADDLQFLAANLPALPFTGKAELAMEEESIRIDPFEFTFGESNLSGSLGVQGGDANSFDLTARSTLIDLTPFADEEVEEEAEAEEDEEADARYVFKEEPLPLDAWSNLRSEVDVVIDQLKMSAGQFSDFKVTGSASDGALTLENSFAGGLGGSFENVLQLNASATSADLDLQVRAKDLKLGMLAGEDIPSEQIPSTGFNMDIKASGASARQMAASTDGRVVLTAGPGRVKNSMIGKFSGDIVAQVFGALNPLAEEEEYSNWECTILALDFESGMGEMSGFLMQGEKLMIVGGGEVDLNTEKINIEFNTKPREGVGISADMFVTPFVALTGTLADPGVGLNAKGALLSGGAAVLTGGLSFLYKGLMDRATAEEGRCEETLAEIGAPQS